MKRAHPTSLRTALEAAQALAKTGVLFVPVPVLNTDDHVALSNQMIERLSQLEQQAEKSP